MLELTIDEAIRITYCNNSVRIATDDYHFFHPAKLTYNGYGSLTILYTEDWTFRLMKSEKINNEWVTTETILVIGENIKDYLTEIPILHKPKELKPLENVEPLLELLDE